MRSKLLKDGYRRTERLFRELGNPHDLSISLANQANLLNGVPDRNDDARQLADEALAT
jgi:hypothetical protein